MKIFRWSRRWRKLKIISRYTYNTKLGQVANIKRGENFPICGNH